MGSPNAANGWPWMDTLGLREACNAQRNRHCDEPATANY
jgi:hypothetical protein